MIYIDVCYVYLIHIDCCCREEIPKSTIYRKDFARLCPGIGVTLVTWSSSRNPYSSVPICNRFQSFPMESHLKVVKKIMEYVKHTTKFGLEYPKQTHFDLCAYTDSHFARSKNNRKVIVEHASCLDHALFHGCVRRKTLLLSPLPKQSTTRPILVYQILWMQQTLQNFGLKMKGSLLYCDNISATSITMNPVLHCIQSTLRLSITSVESMCKMETWIPNICAWINN